MRYAIFSDLHANLQAWEAVRADMERQRIDVHVCLGDVVGYGPRPQEVLESVYELTQNFVLGNHDAVIGGRLDPEIFNDHAKEIIRWTSDHLNEDARLFFGEVPFTIEGAGFLAVHAEAAQPGRFRYIVESEDARESFDATKEQIIFVGHTHHPGRFEKIGRDIFKFGSDGFDVEKGKRYVVNTGSVGEPRTPDIHASYCIYDSYQKKVVFRKLPFDIEAYKRDLEEVGLPIYPYFLDVYESGGATVVHQPAELAMKRSPKIVASGTLPGHTRGVVVKNRDGNQEARSFGSAASSYKMAAQPDSGKSAALWITLSLAAVLLLAVGIFALTRSGKGEGETANPTEVRVGVENPEAEWDLGGMEAVATPDSIEWENLVIAGYKNLARGAKVTSDGFPPEWGSKGEGAITDGDTETFLKKVDGKDSYRVALDFKKPTKVMALSLSGMAHHENAPEDFSIYADGKKLLEIQGAVYVENRILIPLPKITISKLELRISQAYAGAPAIRELGVYDWEQKEDLKAVADAGPKDPGSPAAPVSPGDPIPSPGGKAPEEIAPHMPIELGSGQIHFLPVANQGKALWHFTTTAPAADWNQELFKIDGAWENGVAGFGKVTNPDRKVGTAWTTSDIWMRTKFEIPPGKLDRGRTWYLLLYFDDSCVVYLNGNKIFDPKQHVPRYVEAGMPAGVKNLLKEGTNTLAVHCHQEAGEQFIDVGVVSEPVQPTPAPVKPDPSNLAKNWGPNSLLANYTNLAQGATASRPDKLEDKSGNGVANLNDGNGATKWIGKPGGSTFEIALDFGKEIEFNGLTFAGVAGSRPKAAQIFVGNSRLNVTGMAPNQLLEFETSFKARNLRVKINEWEGESPGIKELGVYLIDPKGTKPSGSAGLKVPGSEDVVRLQRGNGGYENTADVRIAVRAVPGTGQPSRGINMGGQKRIVLGTHGGQVNRGLLRFDLTGNIPEGKKPGAATLLLSGVSGINGQTVDLYLVHPKNGAWVEGKGIDGKNQGEAGGATWVNPDSASRGSWFGGDGLGLPGANGGYLSLKEGARDSPVCSAKYDDKKKRLQFQLPKEVVQLWAERPETNTGILLRVPDEDSEGDRKIILHSAESDENSKRPVLEFRLEE